MSNNSDRPEPDSDNEAENEQDRRVGAKMRLFLDRMIDVACEEEGVEIERATDIMLCAAVGLYVERFSTTPRDLSLLCRAIAEDVLGAPDNGDTVH